MGYPFFESSVTVTELSSDRFAIRVLGLATTSESTLLVVRTSMLRLVFTTPFLLFAEIVYFVTGNAFVGVPPIEPVVASKTSPSGSTGEIEKLLASPAARVGVRFGNETRLIRVSVFIE
jgi:hypothetical protein